MAKKNLATQNELAIMKKWTDLYLNNLDLISEKCASMCEDWNTTAIPLNILSIILKEVGEGFLEGMTSNLVKHSNMNKEQAKEFLLKKLDNGEDSENS